MNLTLIIILITVGISLFAWNNPGLYTRFLMNPYQVFHQGQVYRMVTSGFIHSGYIHLGFNMFTLYFFGNAVETIFGQVLGPGATLIFVLYYVSAIIISDIPTAIKNKNNPGYNSLGASGAVSAIQQHADRLAEHRRLPADRRLLGACQGAVRNGRRSGP